MHLLLIVGLAGVSAPGFAEPLEPPLVRSTLQIDREAGGGCSELRAGPSISVPILTMKDVCHGWTTATCLDKLFVHGFGVMADQAQVLFTEKDRAIDLLPLVDAAIGKRWPKGSRTNNRFRLGVEVGWCSSIRRGSHVAGG
jgi:hypothetical protein